MSISLEDRAMAVFLNYAQVHDINDKRVKIYASPRREGNALRQLTEAIETEMSAAVQDALKSELGCDLSAMDSKALLKHFREVSAEIERRLK